MLFLTTYTISKTLPEVFMDIKMADLARRIYSIIIPEHEWEAFKISLERDILDTPDSMLIIPFSDAQPVIDSMLVILNKAGVTKLTTIDKESILVCH